MQRQPSMSAPRLLKANYKLGGLSVQASRMQVLWREKLRVGVLSVSRAMEGPHWAELLDALSAAIDATPPKRYASLHWLNSALASIHGAGRVTVRERSGLTPRLATPTTCPW